MLSLDLIEGCIQNWKKDEAHRRVPLSEIKGIKATGDASFTILFHTLHHYKLQAESPTQQAMLVGILQAASQKDYVPKMDDQFFPPYRCKRANAVVWPLVAALGVPRPDHGVGTAAARKRATSRRRASLASGRGGGSCSAAASC